MDEFVNIMKLLTSIQAMNAGKKRTKNYLFEVIKNRVLKAYDADNDENFMNIIKKKTIIEMEVFRLCKFIQLNDSIILTKEEQQTKLLIRLLNKGKKCSVSITSLNGAKRLCDEITNNCPYKRVVIISSEGAFENVVNNKVCMSLKKILINDTTQWEIYDCVCYTQTIQTGVSFDNKWFFYAHFH